MKRAVILLNMLQKPKTQSVLGLLRCKCKKTLSLWAITRAKTDAKNYHEVLVLDFQPVRNTVSMKTVNPVAIYTKKQQCRHKVTMNIFPDQKHTQSYRVSLHCSPQPNHITYTCMLRLFLESVTCKSCKAVVVKVPTARLNWQQSQSKNC